MESGWLLAPRHCEFYSRFFSRSGGCLSSHYTREEANALRERLRKERREVLGDIVNVSNVHNPRSIIEETCHSRSSTTSGCATASSAA